MKKIITVCFILCAAIILVGAQTGFASPTYEGVCITCHGEGFSSPLHTIHTGQACTICHPGTAGAIPIPSSNCIVCHPPANPGLCPLINDSRAGAAHGQTCLACHIDCNPTTTCTYSISPTSKTFRASGGKGAVRVSTENGCDWKATSTYSWITIITSSASGSGSGRVTYTVATNPDTTERTGSMDIAGETFTVLQAGRRR
jgi:hypothetical protein